MQEWFAEHLWTTFILIYVFLVYIYNKVFRVKKLPILKDLIIYLIIGAGAFILLLFQVDIGLPIVVSLGFVIAMMLILRIRYFIAEKTQNKQNGK
jgi:hypothetical protein